jgi:hypothetical protein
MLIPFTPFLRKNLLIEVNTPIRPTLLLPLLMRQSRDVLNLRSLFEQLLSNIIYAFPSEIFHKFEVQAVQ